MKVKTGFSSDQPAHHARHDRGKGHKVDRLIVRVLVALPVMGNQLIDPAGAAAFQHLEGRYCSSGTFGKCYEPDRRHQTVSKHADTENSPVLADGCANKALFLRAKFQAMPFTKAPLKDRLWN
ncbi:MAG: hypothetical protein ACK5A0_07995 [Polaromonas sp.]|jgi:hypothetical protein